MARIQSESKSVMFKVHVIWYIDSSLTHLRRTIFPEFSPDLRFEPVTSGPQTVIYWLDTPAYLGQDCTYSHTHAPQTCMY